MEDKEAAVKIDTIRNFAVLADKVKQAIRIYNELYERRAQCYASLSGTKPGLLGRFFRKSSAYTQGNPFEGLRIVNDRETRVVGIVEGAYKAMLPALKQLDPAWKKHQSHLFTLDTYFSKVIGSQKEFLNAESEFISRRDASEIQDLKESSKRYFSLLDENALLITREFGNFYSPNDFSALLARKQAQNPVMAHLDLMGYIAIFVAEFAGVSVFNHSMPEQLFDVSKFPPLTVFAEYVVICYFLMVFNVPAKSWNAVKSSSRAITRGIASLAPS